MGDLYGSDIYTDPVLENPPASFGCGWSGDPSTKYNLIVNLIPQDNINMSANIGSLNKISVIDFDFAYNKGILKDNWLYMNFLLDKYLDKLNRNDLSSIDFNKINGLISNSQIPPGIRFTANNVLFQKNRALKNYSKAVDVLDRMKYTFPELESDFIFRKACIYIFDMKDKEKANAAIKEYESVINTKESKKAVLLSILGNSMKWIKFLPPETTIKKTNINTDLISNYPNPFNPETTIKYTIKESGDVNIIVYNILGQKVKTLVNRYFDAGIHEVKWDGTNICGNRVSSGVYFYRLVVNGKVVDTKKMLMVK